MTEIGATPAAVLAKGAAAPDAPHANGEPAVQNYTDGYAYEVPRPFLTLDQAAQILGMTLRSLERSVLGRWGSKLPAGWVARRMKTSSGDEWRILPPPGFRVKLNAAASTESDTTAEPELPELIDEAPAAARRAEPARPVNDAVAYYGAGKKRQPWRPERHTIDQPTIVIDRTEEVEHLLRELLSAKTALAEERRLHMEDLRMITQLQSSMRLLEVNAQEQSRTRMELEAAKSELSQWREKYNQLVNLPWWRRLLGKNVQV